MDGMFGVSQAFDKRGNPVTLIRLKYVKGAPSFQKVLSGPHEEVLSSAKKIRDQAYRKLRRQGWDPEKTKRRVNPVRTNTSGVTGVRFGIERAKSGHGWYQYWQVSWSDKHEDGTPWPRAKSFHFSKYGGGMEAFFAAVDFRRDRELELYGHTLINPLKYLHYWETASKTIRQRGRAN